VRPQPRLALTFDDRPAHSDLPPGQTRASVMQSLAASLKAAGAPAHGFMNAGYGAGEPSAAAAISAWREAGLPMGNHGHDHKNLEDLDRAGFAEQLVTNEPAVDAANGRAAARWFRYPFLSEGSSPALRDAARATLSERGYRIAAVTMSFADYDYNPPYARCMAKHDMAGVALLERGWLAAVRRDAEMHRARSQALYGRDVPQVLLMHVGAFDARMLPRTLALYRQLGFRFVSLAKAQADPFYATANDPRLPGPSPSLDRAGVEAGLAPPPVSSDVPSSSDLQQLCR
jgi:peptidoglycan/xylan/chitin deacetylase (PgdA/CDA1 family)